MCFRSHHASLPLRLLLPLPLLTALTGCLPGLSVVPLQTASGKPANVAVYLKVETNDGRPVANLTASEFTIFEDGARLPRALTKQTLLSPKLGAARDTLLLIDVSGTTVGTREVGDLIKAASAFTDRVQATQNVAVYTFDGSPDLNAVVPFPSDPAAPAEPTSAFRPKDPKATFDAAVVEGMRLLRAALAGSPNALKLGTLVAFTDGTNRGTLSSAADLHTALAAPENSKLDMFAVGLGRDVDAIRLSEIGRSGTVTETDTGALPKAFDAIALKVLAAEGRYYLLSYCTPSRSGSHELRIEARSHDGLIGDLAYRFEADGFVAGCDPAHPSPFDPIHEPEPVVVEAKKEPAKHAPRKAPPSQPAPPRPSAPAAPPGADPFAP